MKLNSLLAGVALIAMTVSASAADLLYSNPAPRTVAYNDNGVYGALRGGVIFPDDVSANFGTSPNGVTGSFDDVGYIFSGAVGTGFGNWGWLAPRIEAEIEYSSANLASGQFFNAGGPVGAPFALDGKVSTLAAFGNLIVDVPLNGWGFTPFVGIGGGFYDADFRANTGGFNVMDDNDTGFAWKLIAGLTYDLSRNVKLEAIYNFTTLTDVNVNGVGGLTTGGQDVESHAAKLGIRVGL